MRENYTSPKGESIPIDRIHIKQLQRSEILVAKDTKTIPSATSQRLVAEWFVANAFSYRYITPLELFDVSTRKFTFSEWTPEGKKFGRNGIESPPPHLLAKRADEEEMSWWHRILPKYNLYEIEK